jgi:hypothetical protein
MPLPLLRCWPCAIIKDGLALLLLRRLGKPVSHDRPLCLGPRTVLRLSGTQAGLRLLCRRPHKRGRRILITVYGSKGVHKRARHLVYPALTRWQAGLFKRRHKPFVFTPRLLPLLAQTILKTAATARAFYPSPARGNTLGFETAAHPASAGLRQALPHQIMRRRRITALVPLSPLLGSAPIPP